MSPSGVVASLASRLDFPALLTQDTRLLRLSTALPELALLPERLVMREALSQPYELTLDALSTSRHLALKALIGQQLTVELLGSDGAYHPWHGYVFEAAQLGGDGGLARYRLVMRPWLSLLALRRDSRVFQCLCAQQVIERVFAGHPQAEFGFQLARPLRVRSLCTQYQETDLDFVQRLLAEEGLHYHFEQLAGPAASSADQAGRARHRLVVTDAQAPRPGLGEVPFTSAHATAWRPGQRDAVTQLAVTRHVAASAVTLGAWDYKALGAPSAQAATADALAALLPSLEHYDGSGAYRYPDDEAASAAAWRAMQGLELGYERLEGRGSARHFTAGGSLSLVEHSRYGGLTQPDGAFTLLAVEHHAANNLGAGMAELLGAPDIEQGGYRNHFHAVAASTPLLPRFVRKPTAPGLQSALVVGLANEALTTDRDLRVKVQFPWQRGERPLAGGLPGSPDHPHHAPGDERSGTWVRVAQPSAGANWGSVFVPRIGTEVAVQFVEADIDRPLIAGQLYNGQDHPPFAAGVGSGVNHPGVISGLSSRALDGAGANALVLDDAPGQLRTSLHCTYAAAELALGHLIAQSDTGAWRGAWRGTGLLACTQGWATLRAGAGLLVSTAARPGTYGSAAGTQMDAAEALAQLNAGRDLGQRLGEAAQAGQAQALPSHDEAQALDHAAQAIDPQRDGRHAGPVNGQPEFKAGDDGRTPGTDPVESFARPQLVLHSASSQAWASPASLMSWAGQATSWVAQAELHQAAAHTYAQVSGKGSSLYTHAGGARLIAANGPLSVRAHTDALQLWADRSITIASVNDEIRIQAQTRIELIAGSSSLVLDGADIAFTCPGQFDVKGSLHIFEGGGHQAAELPVLPDPRVAALGEAEGTFKSSFARDQLQRFAREALPDAFTSDMAAVFGNDIPISAYLAFHSQAQGGLPEVPHALCHGGAAEFDAARGCIWVGQGLAARAARGEERAQWDMLLALVQAYGAYLAHQLRNIWSDTPAAGDTVTGERYALSLLELDQGATLTYATLQSPEGSGPLQAPVPTMQWRVTSTQTRFDGDRSAAQADGVLYRLHDGVYRPERDGPVRMTPVFDAKMLKDDPRPGVYNHHQIEEALREDFRFQAYERGMVYYGNWLRDWSQLCDGFMLPPGQVGLGLSREHLTTAVMLMGQLVASTYLEGEDWARARPDIEFHTARLGQSMSLLGCYRPEEHIDNPVGLPDSREFAYPKGWLVDLPIDQHLLQVDPATGMRRYIGDPNLTSDHPSSLVYLQRQIRKACALGNTPSGLIELGAALHVLEDYFAHTNFVELALIKAGKREVIAWVPRRPDLKAMPITTGQFTSEDALFSLMYKLADLTLPGSQTGQHMTKLRYDGLELCDWVVWAILHDSGRRLMARVFKGYCQVMYTAGEAAKGYVPDAVRRGYEQARGAAYGYLAAAAKRAAGGSIRTPQIEEFDFEHSINPTHTMLAKDANDHPLHGLAAQLAMVAVRDVGPAVADVWQGKASVEHAVQRASKYFVHPAYSSLLDGEVDKWAMANERKVQKAADQAAAKQRAQEHGHGHGHQRPPMPPQLKPAWQFWTMNYKPLTGREDMLPEYAV